MTDGVKVHAPFRLDGQRRLDGIVDVIAVDHFMNAHALFADGMQKRGCIAGKDFTDGCESEHGMEPPDSRGQFVGWPPAAGVLNGLDGLPNAIDRIADSVRKITVEQEELENSVWSQVGGIDLAVRLECCATAQQAHLLKI